MNDQNLSAIMNKSFGSKAKKYTKKIKDIVGSTKLNIKDLVKKS